MLPFFKLVPTFKLVSDSTRGGALAGDLAMSILLSRPLDGAAGTEVLVVLLIETEGMVPVLRGKQGVCRCSLRLRAGLSLHRASENPVKASDFGERLVNLTQYSTVL